MSKPNCSYLLENLKKSNVAVGYFFGKVFCNKAGCENISESFYSSELESNIRFCNTNGILNDLELKAISASSIPVPVPVAAASTVDSTILVSANSAPTSPRIYFSKFFDIFKTVKRTNPKTTPSCAE